MKHKAQHIEIKFDEPEAFTLVAQVASDGDRLAQERAQAEADREAANKRQPDLWT